MSNPLIWTAALLLCIVILPSGVGAFECNELKRFQCKKGRKGPANGCTWARDKFRKHRHFAQKKKLFGVCLNSGQSKSAVFGTPADRCDCGTKCMRKCTTKPGFKQHCYWASRDGKPRSRSGTCLPNRHFAEDEAEGFCSGGPEYPFNDTNIKAAAKYWYERSDKTLAIQIYGDITCWDISEVTNLESVFSNYPPPPFLTFEDLSKWDTSKVTNMKKTFMDAEEFNADLSKWNTSKVTSMDQMFRSAELFHANLLKWDTSKVTNMQQTFQLAKVFKGNLSAWDTSKVTTMEKMFYSANVFNADLSKWNTSAVATTSGMFSGADVFDCSNHLPSELTTSGTSCNNN